MMRRMTILAAFAVAATGWAQETKVTPVTADMTVGVKTCETPLGRYDIAEGATLTLDLSKLLNFGRSALVCSLTCDAADRDRLRVVGYPETQYETTWIWDDATGYGTLKLARRDYQKTKIVRVHPNLTRGLEREALIGVRPSRVGGFVTEAVFRVQYRGCGEEALSDFRLWKRPGQSWADLSSIGGYEYPTPHFYVGGYNDTEKDSATELTAASTVTAERSATTETGDGWKTFTLTYRDTATGTSGSTWIYAFTGQSDGWEGNRDSVWLTARLDPEVPTDAEFRVSVERFALTNGVCVAEAEAPQTVPPHRVLPQRYRVTTYMRNDYMQDSGAVWVSDPLDDHPDRLPSLSDIFLIDIYPLYDDGALTLSWNQKPASQAGKNFLVDDDACWERLKTLREEAGLSARNLRLKLCLTKGAKVTIDGRTDYLLGFVSRDDLRAKAVHELVTLLERLGADGLDIDWEYPENAESFRGYALLVADLADIFFERGWELSLCTSVGWRFAAPGTLASVDFISSMAYDGGALNAPLSKMLGAVSSLTARGVPKRRITVGQAVYGSRKQPGWKTIVGTLGEANGYTGYDDDMATVNGEASVSYTGPTTYRAKVAYCRDQDYGGIMSWGYYSDVAWTSDHSLGRHQARVLVPGGAYAPPEPEKDADGTVLLDSESDWDWFSRNAGTVRKAALTADIVFGTDPRPVPSFSGELDGRGHTLTLPKDVWIVTYDDVGLFAELTGTVRDLTLDVAGRIVSRRDRKIDAATGSNGKVSFTARGGEGAFAGALAAKANAGAVIDGVTLILREGSEVRGQHEVGGLIGQLWCAGGGSLTVRDCTVDLSGTVTTYASDSSDAKVRMTSQNNADVGALVGQMNWAETGKPVLADNRVILRPTAVIHSECGTQGGAGGAIGNINRTVASGVISGLDVLWYEGASVTSAEGNGTAAFRAQPWAGNRNGAGKDGAPALAECGSLIYNGSGDFPWAAGALWVRESDALPSGSGPLTLDLGDAGLDAEGEALLRERLPLPPAGVLTVKLPAAAADRYLVFDGLTAGWTVTGGVAEAEVPSVGYGVTELAVADGTVSLGFGIEGATLAPGVKVTLLRRQADGSFVPVEGVSPVSALAADGAQTIGLTLPRETGPGPYLYKVRLEP